ncbi:hypothetical protein AgCh_024503 [Apium graveolens]
MINLIEHLGQLGFTMDGELSQDLVLQSLPSSFSQFVVNFHMNKLDVSLPELHNMLKTAESNFPPKKSSVLLIGEGSNPKKRKRNPSKKKKLGEKMPVPPKAEDRKRKVVCFHYNKVGHWKRNCKVYLAELKKKKGSETTASDSAYVKKVDPDKMEYRSGKYSFGGYPKETLGYYFYTDHRVFVSRHATFFEKEFILEGNSGSKIELDEVQEAQTTTDQVETPVLIEQPFIEQPIHRSGRVSRQLERVDTHNNITDPLTKLLYESHFDHHKDKMGSGCHGGNEEELIDYEEEDGKTPDSATAKASSDAVKNGYVGIHSSGFRDFLLKPELLRAIVDFGFEHPSEGKI